MTARFTSIVAGTWLIASAFVWPHSPLQKANAIVCGLLAIGLAVLNLYSPRLRYLSAVLAAWVVAFAVVAPGVPVPTRWSNAIAAVGILIGLQAGRAPRRVIV
ncbi:MAG TPA: hypothetical protein VHG72_05260 [Polyangia bacterium]|nr:hypothetical protein [Polyangia bacterium]